MVKMFGMKRSGIHHVDAISNWLIQVTVGYRCGFFFKADSVSDHAPSVNWPVRVYFLGYRLRRDRLLRELSEIHGTRPVRMAAWSRHRR